MKLLICLCFSGLLLTACTPKAKDDTSSVVYLNYYSTRDIQSEVPATIIISNKHFLLNPDTDTSLTLSKPGQYQLRVIIAKGKHSKDTVISIKQPSRYGLSIGYYPPIPRSQVMEKMMRRYPKADTNQFNEYIKWDKLQREKNPIRINFTEMPAALE